MKRTGFHVTSYCNFAHALSDGAPIGHECYVIPPKALVAEMEGADSSHPEWQKFYSHPRKGHMGRKLPVEPISTENNAPNLDAMEQYDLVCFYEANKRRSNKRARDLFGFSGKGTLTAAHALANYAMNKAVAMGARKEGRIETALKYEAICDRIYNSLPDYARW